MDCESCGRHRPSDQVIPARSSNGTLLMLCGPCRRHIAPRGSALTDLQRLPATLRHAAVPAA